jgi:hypothetical protein
MGEIGCISLENKKGATQWRGDTNIGLYNRSEVHDSASVSLEDLIRPFYRTVLVKKDGFILEYQLYSRHARGYQVAEV